MLTLLLVSSLAALDHGDSTSAKLWIVDDDGGPGVDFTEPQLAVEAAAGGDTILIRAGTYGPIAIEAKSLVVCGDPPGAVILSDAQLTVTNLGPSQTVLLRNLEVHGLLTLVGFSSEGRPAFHAAGNAGPVRVEDCRFLASDLGSFPPWEGFPMGGGALVESSSAVSFTRCVLEGGLATSVGGGTTGLRAVGSNVALYDCTVTGGGSPGGPCGAFGGCGSALPAGTGAVIEDSLVFASGCAFAGGAGGDGEDCFPFGMGGDGSDGGDGAHLATSGATLRALACAFTAGEGGDRSACTPGIDGEAIRNDGGTFAPLAGIARSLKISSPIAGGTSALVEIQVGPNELVFGIASPSPAFLPLDVFDGVLLCQPNATVIPLGAASASGELSFAAPTSVPPPGSEAVVHYFQVGVLTTTFAIKLGSNATLVLLK